MAGIKEFAALQSLRDRLKREQEERIVADARRREQEALRLREANLFKHSIGTVAPLRTSEKAVHEPMQPEPIARHHIADEQAALAQSLSDEFSIETLLETDEGLSYARTGIGQETVRKLRRGHWVTQGQLDLHAMRTGAACAACG
jgi:DNA-nicking Smr family endonuclease